MIGDNRNLFFALVVSMGLLFLWQFFFFSAEGENKQNLQTQKTTEGRQGGLLEGVLPGSVALPPYKRDASRIGIVNKQVKGSLRLEGSVFDDLLFLNLRSTPDPNSPHVRLLMHTSTDIYDVSLGWKALGEGGTWVSIADETTPWGISSGETLSPNRPVVLHYDHPSGLHLTRTLHIDEDSMITVESRIQNNTGKSKTISNFARVRRSSPPETSGYFLLHEGPIGFFQDDGGLEHFSYADLEDEATRYQAKNGWLGITDKYWATVAIPDQRYSFQATLSAQPLFLPFSGQSSGGQGERYLYHVFSESTPIVLQSGKTVETITRFFLGTKEQHLLASYEEEYDIPSFISLIDWGWLWFLTIPMFYLLRFFGDLLGNFGWSIVVVSALLRLAFWPVLRSSYRGMAKMRRIHPELTALRKRYVNDAVAMQKAMMGLYRKAKINPLSSILPMLIQIPFFFALYKVLFTTIEMRQAPFFGWIHDLSASDPLNLFMLFGILDWTPPWFLTLGLWPILMGGVMYLTMRIQQNNQAMAPSEMMATMQKMMLYVMPVFMAIIMSHFPVGLVIYSISNTALSLPQQLLAQREFSKNPNHPKKKTS